MAFWSGEKLALHLPSLITGYNPDNLDCASYRLCVGDQVFVTSDSFSSSGPTEALVSVLEAPPKNILRIRPGQFAFLLTEESVRVPNDAIAFISMRARYKFKGLINVSGFHVDPGWSGKLLFSVYNAGPGEVILEKSDPIFLIVYADLDRMSSEFYKGTSMNQTSIKSSLLESMTEQVFSPLMLQRKLISLESKITSGAVIEPCISRLSDLESKYGAARNFIMGIKWLGGSILALMLFTLAFSPGWMGVMLAKALENGGYEMKLTPKVDATTALHASEKRLNTQATTATEPMNSTNIRALDSTAKKAGQK